MAKRVKVPLLGFVMVLMCFALSFGFTAWNDASAIAEGEAADEVVVIDAVDDFAYTNDSKTEICGHKFNNGGGIGGISPSLNPPDTTGLIQPLGLSEQGYKKAEDARTAGKRLKIVIPEQVEIIGNGAFIRNIKDYNDFTSEEDFFDQYGGYENLTDVEFAGNNCWAIGQAAFVGTGITSLDFIPASVTSVGAEAFSNCKIEELTLDADNKVLLKGASNVPGDFGGNFDSPAFGALSGCNIGKLTVAPEANVTEFSTGSMLNCKVDNLYLPQGFTSFGTNNFLSYMGAVTVKNIYYHDFAEFLAIDMGDGDLPVSVLSAADLYIGNEQDGYNRASVLPQLTVPANATKIGKSAFAGCSNLVSVVFENENDIVIGEKAFYNCKGLNEVVFKKNNATLGNGAFSQSPVKYLYAPEGFASTGSDGLQNKTVNTEAYTGDNYLYKGDFVFMHGDTEGSWVLAAYAGRATDVVFPKAPFIENGVTVGKYDIPENMFAGNTVITSIVIPENSVRSIGNGAFSYCTALQTVTVSGKIEEMGSYVFSGSYIRSASLPGIEVITEEMFSSCGLLSNVSMPDARIIGVSAFEYCNQLRALTLSDTVERVEKKAFSDCGIAEIDIGKNVSYIGESAFWGNEFTGTVHIPATVKEIGASAFASCSRCSFKLDSYADGTSDLRTIGSGAFHLTNLEMPIPEGVETMGANVASWTHWWVLPTTLKEIGGGQNFWSLTVKQAYSADDSGYAARYANLLVSAKYNSENSKYDAEGDYNYATTVMVMPDYASYKAVYDEIVANRAAYDAKAEVNAKKVNYLTRLFYVDEVTFQIKKDDGSVAAQVVQNTLVRYGEDGATKEACLNAYQTNGPAKFWRINRDYTLPTKIGLYTLSDTAEWKNGEQAVTLTPPEDKSVAWFFTTPLTGEQSLVLTTQIAASEKVKVSLPFTEVTVTYSGYRWKLPAEYDDLFVLAKNNDYGVNVNTGDLPYTASPDYVKYELRDPTKYEWADGRSEKERSIRIYITPYETELIWEYKGVKLNADEVYEKIYDNSAFNNTNDLKIYANAPDGENKVFVPQSYLRTYLDGVPYDGGAVSAGNWRIDVQNGWNYNYKVSHTSHSFRIEKATLDLNDFDNMQWGLGENSAELGSGSLYLYNNVPYIGVQSDLGTPEVVSVTRSYARYRKAELAVGIGNIPLGADGKNIYSVTVSGEYKATEVGKYTAIATITASDNYRLVAGLGTDVTARGINIVLNADGTSATVSKVWYIVALENRLVLSDGDTDFALRGWTFGETPALPAPMLDRGTDNVTFTLSRNNELIGELSGFGIGRYNHFINPTMPAGDYVLTADISDVSIDGIIYKGSVFTYRFTVAKTAMEYTLPDPTDDGYAQYEWELGNNADKSKFFAKFEGEALKDKISITEVTRMGYWAEHDEYYSENAVISYNFARMSNNRYLTADDGNIQKLISGGAQGTYKVYFQISALNHDPLTDMSEGRYAYFFTVTVYETLAVPTVNDDGLVYTGSKVLPDIAEDGKYTVVWSDTDTYISGGDHSVSFVLTDSVHYRWQGVQGDTASVTFNVEKADNVFTVALNMLGWNFETFDAAVNNIRAAVKFLDDGKNITFLVTKKGEATAVTGLEGFTIDGNGKVNDTVAGLLNGLSTGEYTLYAKIDGTGNYNVLERNIDFKVSKAMNAWADGDEDLALPSWIVGKYNVDENPIVVNAAHGSVNIVITDIDGNEYYNSVTGVNKLNDCEVGKYLLKAWVDETEDFAALAERTFTIEVLEKVGMPWWGTLLITLGALLLAAAILFVLWKKGVFQILTQKIVVAIRTRASVEATIASVRTAKKMEEGKQSVAEAKRRERIEEMRKKAAEQRALPPEERAAQLEERAKTEAEKAEKSRKRSEQMQARAARLRGTAEQQSTEVEQEAAATDDTETPAEE